MREPPLPEPVLSHLGAGDRWQLVMPCEIPMGGGVTMTVPAGFCYDLSSIPNIGPVLWIVGEDDELSTLAPLCHDALYRHDGAVPVEWLVPYYRTFIRREADDLLYTLAVRQGCARWRARLAWAGVRVFGRRW